MPHAPIGPYDSETRLHVGFTGTREGLTLGQREALRSWLALHAPERCDFYHGACVGADEQFVAAVREVCSEYLIYAHPSTLSSLTSPDALRYSTTAAEPLPPLDRNRAIVAACEVLLACPKGAEEQRSGTWATVRYARKAGKPVVIFSPDGTVTKEGE